MGANDLTKKQRIETLEKEVSELKLIVHELRERKETIIDIKFDMPSTDISVEDKQADVIEFEGQQYQKVEREAREGDVVSVSFKDGECFKPNKFYGPVFKGEYDLKVKGDSSTGKKDYEETLVYNDYYGRTPETVNVYEPIKQPVQRQTVPCSVTRPPIEEVGQAFFEGASEVLNPKTANQLRVEVIEKAKGFVEKHKKERHMCIGAKGHPHAGEAIIVENVYIVPKEKNLVDSKYNGATNAEFIINEEKRTVVALLRGATTKRLMSRGIAKCDPNDVFNSHIGKAIALGRALGLDVSEFEQAVQPTWIVKGMVATDKDGDVREVKEGHDHDGYPVVFANDTSSTLKIINDTNAIYGGVE